MHNAVNNVDFLAPHLNLGTSSLYHSLLNTAIPIYYKGLNVVCDEIVVLDAMAKELLARFGIELQVKYVPHWVKPRTTSWTKLQAKKKLGLPVSTKVILSFGFISSYKGSDQLAKIFKQVTKGNKDYHLIFAGGKAPSREQTPSYQRYFDEFKAEVDTQKNVTLTGFVPDDSLGLYLSAADLAVFPYRGLMGGSGALSYAVGFKKPFLISTAMNSIWKNKDMADSLGQVQLTQDQVMIPMTTLGIRKLLSITDSNAHLRKLVQLSKVVMDKRHINKSCQKLYTEVYTSELVNQARMIDYAPAIRPVQA